MSKIIGIILLLFLVISFIINFILPQKQTEFEKKQGEEFQRKSMAWQEHIKEIERKHLKDNFYSNFKYWMKMKPERSYENILALATRMYSDEKIKKLEELNAIYAMQIYYYNYKTKK